MNLLPLIPKRYHHIAKTIVAALGMFLTILPVVASDRLEWVAGITSVCAVLGIYATPNRPKGDASPA